MHQPIDGAAREQEEPNRYLTFRLGRETFGFDIMCIQEILEHQVPICVPMMPPCVLGVINFRGAVIPVIDLCARLGGRPEAATKKSCIVMLESTTDGEPQIMGALVEAVNQVIEIPASAVEPTPAFGIPVRPEFVTGMGRVDGGYVMILNADAALSIDDIKAMAVN